MLRFVRHLNEVSSCDDIQLLIWKSVLCWAISLDTSLPELDLDFEIFHDISADYCHPTLDLADSYFIPILVQGVIYNCMYICFYLFVSS